MVALEFNALYFSILVFLAALVPGIALGWPLFRKSGLGFAEKLLCSFFIGLFAVPTLLFIEMLVGINFSLFLVLADMFIIISAGLFWGMREGAFAFKLPSFDIENAFTLESAKKFAVPALLMLAMLTSFWICVQPYSPVYSELDPYFYVYGTGQIIRQGAVPPADDSSWWPELAYTGHRYVPIKMYLEAQWYSLYTNGGAYNNSLLFTTSSWLPPISAAFMAFGAYLLVSSIYGRKYGLLAAFLMVFLPITIYKMSAGVNEAAPPGMMLLFISLGALAYALVKKDEAMRLFTAFAFFVTFLASNYFFVVSLPFAALLVLQSLDYFARGKENRDFVLTCTYAFAGAFLANALLLIYTPAAVQASQTSLLPGGIAICLLALAFAWAVYILLDKKFEKHFRPIKMIQDLQNNQKRRHALLAIGIIIGLVLFLFTPLGTYAKSQVSGYIGAAQFKTALEKTIAEQNLAGQSFEGEAGFLALVPSDHIVQNAAGMAIARNFAYSLFGILASVSTFFGNILIAAADMVFRLLVGLNQSTGTKTDSLLFFFLLIAMAGLAIRHFRGSGEERNVPSVMLLIFILMFSTIYVGINKVKYTIFVGVMLVIAAAVAFAELEKFSLWLSRKIKMENAAKYIPTIFIALMFLMVYAEAGGPLSPGVYAGPTPYGYIFLIKSFEPRYQDNPAEMMPKLAKACEDFRAQGYYDEDICNAGYSANYSDDINTQFNSKVCIVSQLSAAELSPGNSTDAQIASQEAKSSASFRCNRMSDYWIDSMEWMNRNLDASDRVTSWWDYGHWTNYFGDKKTVIRNEQASLDMIGRVAHDYIIGSTQDLVDSMNYFDSRYALFDSELIGGINGQGFGGKYGALNYLGCVHEGATALAQNPGTSDCELAHSPERIMIPASQAASTTCTISESQQRTGIVAYTLGKTGVDTSKPTYCIGDATLANGQKISATYYYDRKDANGDLALSKGFMRQIDQNDQYSLFEMVYTEDALWPDGKGGFVGGMEDAKTDFYRSNLYKGVVLGDVPGYDLVYKSKNGEVKIYKMKSFTGNKAGWVDPVESKRQN